MKNWEAAANKVRQRSLDIWRDIKLEVPIEIDISADGEFITEAIQGLHIEEAEVILPFPGRDRLWLSEIIFSAQKYSHVARLTKQRAEEGFVTWAATDAHHAVLLGIKCFLSILGICVSQGNSRAHLVDFRPEQGSVDDKRKFRKRYKQIENPVRIMTPSKKLFEQKDIFRLLERAINICEATLDQDKELEVLKSMNLGMHKPERNRLLYEGEYWHWYQDIIWPSIDIRVKEEIKKGMDGMAKDFMVMKAVDNIVMRNLRPLADEFSLWDGYLEAVAEGPEGKHDPLASIPQAG